MRLTEIGVLAVVVTVGSAADAQAYMDPGSGALIWQTILAAGIGATFYFRRVLGWFRRDKKP